MKKVKINDLAMAKLQRWAECGGDVHIQDLVSLDVEYPDRPHDKNIPDEWLAFAIREFRKNLEYALNLEMELGGYGLSNISPLTPDDEANHDHYGRTHGLSGNVVRFSSLFSRLVDVDVSAAYQEFLAWPVNDDIIFSRLRIFACGNAELMPEPVVGQVIASLSDNAFWDSRHQRDFLLVLSKRWYGLSNDTRKAIENRLLLGPSRWQDEEDKAFQERKAWSSLDRLTWLASNGCSFSFDLETETVRLRSMAPVWKPEYAEKAADPIVGRSGFVRAETEYSSLLGVPLSSILSKARELSGRTADSLVKRDPFLGLAQERPVRVFSALTDAARRNEYPEWAWNTFLNAEAIKKDNPKLSALIAERISRYPNEAVTEIIRPASGWSLNISEKLALRWPRTFDKILSKLINVLCRHPTAGKSTIIRGNKSPEWTTEAINSPVGTIGQALFYDPRKDGLKSLGGFPVAWVRHVNDLLSLCGDLRRYAFVIFAYHLSWFYQVDPNWTEANLLSALEGDNEDDRNAALSGFFWGAEVPNQELYMRMKSTLLKIAKDRGPLYRGQVGVLAGIILAGWGSTNKDTGARWVSNDEMRDVLLHAEDDFRSRILWQVDMWSKDQGKGAEKKWPDLISELFRDVWPRQKAAKTPRMSAQLFNLAFSSAETFPEMAEVILPLLTTVDQDSLMLPSLGKSKGNIVDSYPHQTLALLYAVLPENVSLWPYDMEAIFQRIGKADSNLTLDERFRELKRRWNAR
jgi:hypothetical protein